ncbi:DUF72 domain-containing protein [Oceanobacter mangrovi]|uniref:DUF72 domain-containing protein n=1 Tax=Oceanobacter mangrovi TaxID=2862510 RepID=UPI001C8D98B4|nr:DUF72 domain-containing protein [Oceanobacter mangrovi]
MMTLDQSSAQALPEYSQVFSSVEGNTSFYALPDQQRLQQWLQQVEAPFRFCFKIPRDISHSRDMLQALNGPAGKPFGQFLNTIQTTAPDKLGVIMLQLPATFDASRIGQLIAVLDELLSSRWSGGQPLSLAVECRHLSFFDKTVNEPVLLRELANRQVDRVMFDTRGIMAEQGDDEELLDAQRKKPRMPVHAVATGMNPVVRFIGYRYFAANHTYLQQWFGKLNQWLAEGRSPYVFWHTAGNRDVPEFHRWIMQHYWQQEVEWPGEQAAGVTGDLWG